MRYLVHLRHEHPDLGDRFEALSMEEMTGSNDPAINFRTSETSNVTVWDADIERIEPTEGRSP